MFKVSDEVMIRYVNTLSHEIEIFYKNNRPYARIHKIGGYDFKYKIPNTKDYIANRNITSVEMQCKYLKEFRKINNLNLGQLRYREGYGDKKDYFYVNVSRNRYFRRITKNILDTSESNDVFKKYSFLEDENKKGQLRIKVEDVTYDELNSEYYLELLEREKDRLRRKLANLRHKYFWNGFIYKKHLYLDRRK